MLDIQLGRRNLSPIQRIAITEKYRPIYEKQARENQSKAGGDKKSLSQNSSKAVDPENKIDVRAKLAETAGVSREADNKGKEQQETLKEVESKLAEKRLSIFGATGGRGNKKGVPDSAQGLEEQKKGKARDIVAKNVGLHMEIEI